MPETINFPFNEIIVEAQSLAAKGFKVFQKFTCAKCGQRLTIDKPNCFYQSANCDQCGHVTDIEADGCNYLLIQTF